MNTFFSALVSALILFMSNMVTLFVNDVALEFNLITTSAWVSIGGGAGIAFLKDYQALTSRRLINKMTNSGDGGV